MVKNGRNFFRSNFFQMSFKWFLGVKNIISDSFQWFLGVSEVQKWAIYRFEGWKIVKNGRNFFRTNSFQMSFKWFLGVKYIISDSFQWFLSVSEVQKWAIYRVGGWKMVKNGRNFFDSIWSWFLGLKEIISDSFQWFLSVSEVQKWAI